jgi:hypothetical protein
VIGSAHGEHSSGVIDIDRGGEVDLVWVHENRLDLAVLAYGL